MGEKPEYDSDSDEIIYNGSSLLQDHINNLTNVYKNINDGRVNQDNSLDYLSNKLSRRLLISEIDASKKCILLTSRTL